MHIAADFIAATSHSGGMATYAEGLLQGWEQLGRQEQLTLFLSAEAPDSLRHVSGVVSTYSPRRLGLPSRLFMQHAQVPLRLKEILPDAYLSLTPVLPLASWTLPQATLAIIHDLRHEDRPQDFGRFQRYYRTVVYRRSLSLTRRVVAISPDTAERLLGTYGINQSKVTVVEPGADHVDDWPWSSNSSGAPYCLAFGHHNNKRPGLAIRAWSHLKRIWVGDREFPQLRIIGVSSKDDRDRLASIADSCEVKKHVDILPFVNEARLKRLFAGADLILMVSAYEGYGLPTIEAQRLGIPVVVTQSRGSRNAATTPEAIVESSDPKDVAETCKGALTNTELRGKIIEDGLRRTNSLTWENVWLELVTLLQMDVSSSGSPSNGTRASQPR